MAVTATWDNGVIVVIGDGADDVMSWGRVPDGHIFLNGGNITILNAPPGGATVANTTTILMYGLGGKDTFGVDDSIGPMPFAYFNGGDGDDEINGAAAADWIDSGSGADLIRADGGADFIDSGSGADRIIGGGGADTIVNSPGTIDDRIEWTVGEGSDFVDEARGLTEVDGTNNAETMTIIGGGVGGYGYIFVDETDELVARRELARLEISMLGGNDVLVVSGDFITPGLAGRHIIDAGAGADIVIVNSTSDIFLTGQIGNDYLATGAGADFIYGGGGTDIMSGGAGADRFLFVGTDAGFDYIMDFNAAQGDRIVDTDSIAFAAQFGDHVLVGTIENGFTAGFIVLNAIAAEVQAAIVSS